MRVILLAATAVVQGVPSYQPHHGSEVPFEKVTSADDLAEQAGRLCYLSWDRPNPKTATNKGYLANIIAQFHFSVLEHASASFYIDGVTRNFTHELIRHRHLSFSEVSQRYVDVGEFEFVEHPGIQELDGLTKLSIANGVVAAREAYSRVMDVLTAMGAKRKEARQAARHVLPGGTETRIVVSGNMRAWREMLAKRLSPTADLEFQQVAQKILAELRKIAPNTFQDFEETK